MNKSCIRLQFLISNHTNTHTYFTLCVPLLLLLVLLLLVLIFCCWISFAFVLLCELSVVFYGFHNRKRFRWENDVAMENRIVTNVSIYHPNGSRCHRMPATNAFNHSISLDTIIPAFVSHSTNNCRSQQCIGFF